MNEINNRDLVKLESLIPQIKQKQDELNHLIDEAIYHGGEIQFISLRGDPRKIWVVVYIPNLLYENSEK